MVDKERTLANIETGIELLRAKEMTYEEESLYMSDTKNWCCVHATKYLPRTNPDGTMYIPTTAMATNFYTARSTVHTTLNHVVKQHAYGSWEDMPIVVLAPYQDVTIDNGNPAEVSGMDTYWSLSPDKGLVLPKSAYVVQPDDNGPLFQIGEHSATYKRGNYTDKEIEQILSKLEPEDKATYIRYQNGDLTPQEIEIELLMDESGYVRTGYTQAKNRGKEKEFLKGLFEESRFNILSKYLRDIVVKLSMQHMGMNWVDGIYDGSETSQVIANTAESNGIPGCASNKGHDGSVYGKVEDVGDEIVRILETGTWFTDTPAIFKTDAKTFYDEIAVKIGQTHPLVSDIIFNLIEDRPVDFIKMHQDRYAEERKYCIISAEISLESAKDMLTKFRGHIMGDSLDDASRNRQMQLLRDKISVCRKYIEDQVAKKTLVDYDKNFWETIRRHCAQLTSKYQAWRAQMVKNPEYKNLVKKLRMLVKGPNIMNRGRDM